jgi:hypothetical protein
MLTRIALAPAVGAPDDAAERRAVVPAEPSYGAYEDWLYLQGLSPHGKDADKPNRALHGAWISRAVIAVCVERFENVEGFEGWPAVDADEPDEAAYLMRMRMLRRLGRRSVQALGNACLSRLVVDDAEGNGAGRGSTSDTPQKPTPTPSETPTS